MGHYGIGELTAVTILAELGDCRRFSSSRQAVRYAGMDITVHQSDERRAPGHLSRQGPPALRWALYEAAQARQAPELTRPRLLPGGRASGSAATAPAWRSRASCSKRSYHTLSRARRGGATARMSSSCAPSPSSSRCTAASSRHVLPPRPRGRPRKTERPQRFPQRDHPINHHVAGPEPTAGSWTEIRLGARARKPAPSTARTLRRSTAAPTTSTGSRA